MVVSAAAFTVSGSAHCAFEFASGVSPRIRACDEHSEMRAHPSSRNERKRKERERAYSEELLRENIALEMEATLLRRPHCRHLAFVQEASSARTPAQRDMRQKRKNARGTIADEEYRRRFACSWRDLCSYGGSAACMAPANLAA